MATRFSKNLRLRIDSNLTANAIYNLERIDTLGGVFQIDTTDTVQVRSRGDVVIEPNSAVIGGAGVNGSVQIGTSGHTISNLLVYADSVEFSSGISIQDQDSLTKLRIEYASATSGSPDSSDRTLSLDMQGGNRELVLGGNLLTSGGNIEWAAPAGGSVLTLPQTGTISTLSGSETLSNKILVSPQVLGTLSGGTLSGTTINASQNTISNISNSEISASANIQYSKLALSNQILNSDINNSAGIQYSKLNLAASIQNSDISGSAAIARSKIAAGVGNQVLINDLSGNLSSTSQLPISLGGTGASTIAGILAAILPSQTGMAGRVLGTDGTNLAWVLPASGSVASVGFDWTSGTSITITHGFTTEDIDVSVFDEDGNQIFVLVDIISTTQVTLTSTEAPSSTWRIVIQATA